MYLSYFACLIVMSTLFLSSCSRDYEGSSVDASNLKNDSQLLGKGIDILTGETKGDCISFDGIGPLFGSGTGVNFQRVPLNISSTLQMARSLGLDPKTKFQNGFTDNRKLNFLNEINFNPQSLYIGVKLSATRSKIGLRNAKLTERANALVIDSADEFEKICGDEFISSVTYGTQLYFLFEFDTNSDQDKFDLESLMMNAISSFDRGANELPENSKAILNERVKRIHSLQIGLQKTNVEDSSIESILNYARFFQATVDGESMVPVSTSNSSYIIAENFPIDADLKDKKNAISGLNNMADKSFELFDSMNEANYALENPHQYMTADLFGLESKIESIRIDLQSLDQAARECIQDSSNCIFPDLTDVVLDLPERVSPEELACLDTKETLSFTSKLQALNGWSHRKSIHIFKAPVDGLYNVAVTGQGSQDPCSTIFVDSTSLSYPIYASTDTDQNDLFIDRSFVAKKGDKIEISGARSWCERGGNTRGYPSFDIDVSITCSNQR